MSPPPTLLKESGKQMVKYAPNHGEPLTNYINRNRPEPAPEIRGEPSFDPAQGFCWKQDGWAVLAAIDETGSASVHWHAPDGMPAIGYTLTAAGHREALVPDATDEARSVAGWPVGA